MLASGRSASLRRGVLAVVALPLVALLAIWLGACTLAQLAAAILEHRAEARWAEGFGSTQALLARYRAIHRDLCAESQRVVCGADLSKLLDWPGDYQEDGIHPNEDGQRKIAGAVVFTIGALEGATAIDATLESSE